MNDTIVMLGRGPSLASTKIPDWYSIGAISSGIFTEPGRQAAHWFCLDSAKYFGDVRIQAQGAWATDPLCEWWDALNDPILMKHVPREHNRAGKHHIDGQVQPADVMEVEDIFAIFGLIKKNPQFIGYVPEWGDFRNVEGHPYGRRYDVNLTRHGPFGVDGQPLAKSPLFAVQAAHRIGYKRLLFAGVDMVQSEHTTHSGRFMRDVIYPKALAAGFEWYALSPDSPISRWMPVLEGVAT
jgi:hypothetical protein